MNQNPLISIIIPVYNVAAYLPRCLDSIIGQTYPNLEIILVDDESPDNCPQICEEYAAKDKRIKVIHQKNKGLAGARNTGLDHAHGEFITFVDSDDWLALDAIATYEKTARMAKAKLVWANRIYVYEDGSQSIASALVGKGSNGQERLLEPEEFFCSLFLTSGFSVWDKFFHHSIIGKHRFDTKLTQSEDVDFWSTLLADIPSVAYIPKPLYFYFQRSASMRRIVSCTTHRYNNYIGERLFKTCKTLGFKQAQHWALGWWLTSAGLHGAYILLLDKKNEHVQELEQVHRLLVQYKKFLFANRVMWKPAQFFEIIWVFCPNLLKMGCRLPVINAFLRYCLAKKVGSNR